jgi:hypothetical protein
MAEGVAQDHGIGTIEHVGGRLDLRRAGLERLR